MDLRVGSSYALHGLISYENVSQQLKSLTLGNLNCIEFSMQRSSLNWTRGRPGAPFPSETLCKKIRGYMEKVGINASIHAPYSIVVTSDEPGKIQFAKGTMTATTRVASYLGATHITFHCGSRGPGRKGLEKAKIIFMEMIKARDNRSYDIEYSPEVAGKVKSLGSFQEILELAEHCGTLFTWDIAHDFARGGQVTSIKSLMSRLDEIESRLDVTTRRRLPIHISGIVGTRAGEKYHTPLSEGDGVPWKLFLTALKETGFLDKSGIICESSSLDSSSNWSRHDDAKKIREFCISKELVTKWIPKKPTLNAFLDNEKENC